MGNHVRARALHFLYYNLVRILETLETTVLTAGVSHRLWEVADMVSVLESWKQLF